MTGTLVVAAREIRERGFILLTAVVIALLPFVSTVLPFMKRYGAAEARGAVGAILAIAFALGLAVALGTSMVGRELSDRRLSFYFSRPLPAAAIWFGKLIGAVVLVAVSFAVIFLPSFASARGAWRLSWNTDPGALAAAVLGLSVFLVLAAHAISTMVRSRSALVVLDIIAAAIAAGAFMWITRPLFDALAVRLLATVVAALVAALVIALIGAGAWQLSRGRADVRRSHAAMSRFLWITLGIALALAGAYTAWVVSVDVEDLSTPRAEQSPGGIWSVIAGESAFRGDYQAGFLVNTGDGTAVKLPHFSKWSGGDFNRAGDAVLTTSGPDADLVLYRLGRNAEAVETGIPSGRRVVLSDDRERIAVINDGTVSIHEVDEDRLLVAVPIRPRPNSRLGAFFVSPDVLRLFESYSASGSEQALRIMELDVRTRQIVETGTWTTPGRYLYVRASGDGSTLLARVRGAAAGDSGSAVLLDGRTAAVRATLPAGNTDMWSAVMLVNGRVAMLHPQDGMLRLFEPDGALLREVSINPSARRGRVVAETGSGQLVLSLHHSDLMDGDALIGRETVVVDIASGSIVRRASDITPSYYWWSTDPRAPAPNQTGELAVTDRFGALWLWNIRSGEKKKLV